MADLANEPGVLLSAQATRAKAPGPEITLNPATKTKVGLVRSVGLGPRPSSGVFQSEVVVYCIAESLLAAKIPLSGLNGCMPKQKLDLLKLSACQMA